jgi:cation transport protein ChaC
MLFGASLEAPCEPPPVADPCDKRDIADAPQALHYLWQREMTNRTYHLREVPVATPAGGVAARTFVVDRRHRNYAGRLSLEETARLILQASGDRGLCRHYLENTVAELRKLGQVDGPLHRLEERVRALGASAARRG